MSNHTPLIRQAVIADAPRIWRFVLDSQSLDQNSNYAYLMQCRNFAATTMVAELGQELMGFVLAHILPEQPNTVFVWQIAVSKSARGQGLAKQLVQQLLAQPACENVSFLEATVTESNTASQRLFLGIARTFDAPCVRELCFSKALFPEATHEGEELFRIGPIDLYSQQQVMEGQSPNERL